MNYQPVTQGRKAAHSYGTKRLRFSVYDRSVYKVINKNGQYVAKSQTWASWSLNHEKLTKGNNLLDMKTKAAHWAAYKLWIDQV